MRATANSNIVNNTRILNVIKAVVMLISIRAKVAAPIR